MFDKPNSSHTLGLDIDAFSLKGAAVSLVRGKLQFNALFDFPLQPPSAETDNVKPLYTIEQKEQLEELTNRSLVVTSALTQNILVRPLELKLKKNRDIEAALSFQVEPLLPYPAENAIIDSALLSKDKEGSKLTVFAMRKDHLAQHLSQWQALEITPEVVSAPPQALAAFANQFVANDSPYYVLHLSLNNSFCVLVDKGKVLAAQAIPGGVYSLAEAITQEKEVLPAYELLKERNFLLPQPNDPVALKNAIDLLRISVTRTIYGLAKHFKGIEINEILVTGPGATFNGLAKVLCDPLKKTLISVPEDPSLEIGQQDLLNYALPIGEALTALPNYRDQINFRQEEFAYPEPWKRLKQPILAYFLLCIGIAIALSLFGKAYVSYQEGEIKNRYLELLNIMNRSYGEFEREYTTKNPSPRDLEPGQVIDITSLNANEIKDRLNYLEKEIQATPQIFPLQPNIPLVSDVLAWISSHPNFVNQQKAGKDSSNSLLIENFSYSMVKRPEPQKKQEKYQVKIELEFSSPTPKMAREFHDALIAPNEIVDPKGEVKWSSNKDRYRTSFYLKDKTAYLNL